MAAKESQKSATSPRLLLAYDHVSLVFTRPREIRLLRVLRFDDEQLHCDLRVANLDEKPVYKALSYTWGLATKVEAQRPDSDVSENLKPFIVCNGKSLEVTQNLYDCLLQLNETYPSNRAETATEFWIDAVCIDQTQRQERSQQVSMMSSIYDQAEEVVIWLGLSDDSTPLACEMVRELGSIWSNERLDLRKQSRDDLIPTGATGTLLHLLEINLTKTSVAEASPLGKLHSRAYWRSILQFFSRTWFTRSWVVQEFVLAHRITVLCGNNILEWAHIEAASDFLATRVSSNMLKSWVGEGFDVENAAYKSPAKLEAVKRDKQREDSSILLRSLIRCRNYGCEEDKDKIFSLLGIYQVAARTQLSADDRLLYPNYSLDTTQVYTNAAVRILELETDLSLLYMAEGEDFRDLQKRPNLPSWVPDFGWSFGTWKASIGLGITGYKRFNAARDLKRRIAFSDDKRVLFVEAARLDRIVRVGETKEQVENGEGLDRWLHILESAVMRHCSPESRVGAFWRALITDTDETGRSPARAGLEAGFLEWVMRRSAKLNNDTRQRWMQVLAVGATFQSRLSEEIIDNLVAEYELQFARTLHQRPFLTSEGHIGLGSQSMKIEACEKGECDYSVWVVCGSRVPLILRDTERSGRYNLVGGAYVHGFMQGVVSPLQQDLKFETIGLE